MRAHPQQGAVRHESGDSAAAAGKSQRGRRKRERVRHAGADAGGGEKGDGQDRAERGDHVIAEQPDEDQAEHKMERPDVHEDGKDRGPPAGKRIVTEMERDQPEGLEIRERVVAGHGEAEDIEPAEPGGGVNKKDDGNQQKQPESDWIEAEYSEGD